MKIGETQDVIQVIDLGDDYNLWICVNDGCVRSESQGNFTYDENESQAAMRDGMESLIVALVCRGVRVDTEDFHEAVRTVFDAIANQGD